MKLGLVITAHNGRDNINSGHTGLSRGECGTSPSSGRTRRLFVRAGMILLWMVLKSAPARPSTGPTISVGPGKSSIVEYDLGFRPQRVYSGFQKPTDITPLADGSLLVADEGAQEVVAFDPSTGKVLYRSKFPSGVLRARPRPLGGLVVTSADKVLLTDRTLEVEREIPVKGVRAAVELPGGRVLTVSNEDQGWMTERRPDGSILWRSKPRARITPDGKWVSEAAEQTFVSTSSLDVGGHGEIFATDADAHTLRLLSKDHLVLRFWTVYGMTHFSDTRFGANGELIAVSPETLSIWTEQRDGVIRTWTSPGIDLPLCANVSARGTILVGFQSLPENERLNAALQLSEQPKRPPFPRTLPGAVLLGVSAAILVCAAWRWRDARNASASPRTTDSSAARARPAAPSPSIATERRTDGARTAQVAGATAAFVLAAFAALRMTIQDGGVAPHKMIPFAFACAMGAIALRILNTVLGTSATFSPFSPTWSDDSGKSRTGSRALPVALACLSSGICLFSVLFLPDRPGLAVGTWIAAQVLILAAAFDRPAPGTGHSLRRASALLLGVVLLGAILTRFWEIGQYPDSTHWDHGTYGSAALKILRGDWKPFFITEPINRSIPRPWVAVCAALLGVFGAHYWVLRLTAAISGVVLVIGTYLLGSSLFNRRVGLAAAFLASVNQVLLLYSRQPYVMDPAAFFVLALYCATVGFRSGRRFPWCVAGVLSGWCLLTYWSSTVLAVVGAAIFGAFALFYPRWSWRRRAGMLWMLLGALIVYVPMIPHAIASSSLESRLKETTVVLEPDGSIRRDPAFWKKQLEQTFGTILQHGESSSWNVSTGKPLALGPETVLFGIGLIYLLISGRRAPAAVLLPWIGLGFLLGNGLFPNPNFYHCLAAIPPVVFFSAVTVDRLLALSDSRKPPLRTASTVAALLVMAFIGVLHLRAVWELVGRSPRARANGGPALRADVRSIVPRYIRENANRRYYLVRTSRELSCAEAPFLFFADDSDIYDVTKPPEEVLPVRPLDPPREVAFIVLPGRLMDVDSIRATYPNARTVELDSTIVPKPVQILVVDADSVRRAFEATASKRSLRDWASPRLPSSIPSGDRPTAGGRDSHHSRTDVPPGVLQIPTERSAGRVSTRSKTRHEGWGLGDSQPQQREIAQGRRQEMHLRDALPAENEVDRLFHDLHAEYVRSDEQLGQKREVIVLERQRAKRLGPVHAKSGSLVFSSKPEHDPHQGIEGAAQGQLPKWRAVHAPALDEPRADQDVRVAISRGAEQARNLLRLVIEVRVHRDDVVAPRRDGGETSPEGSAQASRLLLVQDADVRDLAGQILRDGERPVLSLDDVEKLPGRHTLHLLCDPACQRLDVLPLVICGDDDRDPRRPAVRQRRFVTGRDRGHRQSLCPISRGCASEAFARRGLVSWQRIAWELNARPLLDGRPHKSHSRC